MENESLLSHSSAHVLTVAALHDSLTKLIDEDRGDLPVVVSLCDEDSFPLEGGDMGSSYLRCVYRIAISKIALPFSLDYPPCYVSSLIIHVMLGDKDDDRFAKALADHAATHSEEN